MQRLAAVVAREFVLARILLYQELTPAERLNCYQFLRTLAQACPVRKRMEDLGVRMIGQLQSQRATILIVNDDSTLAEMFARMLTLEGFNALTAVDPETGLYEAEAAQVDAILLDLQMPRVDGLAFLRRLRAHQDGREMPVAIVTADIFLDRATINDLRELGAATYFKPLWVDDLVCITRGLLRC
jgi:CheY-like chemotaxis protein